MVTTIEIPKTSVAKKLPLTKGTDYSPPQETGVESLSAPVVRTEGSGALAPVIDIDRLYPATEKGRPELLKALRFLADAVALLELADKSFRQADPVGADRYLQRLQFLLLDLFNCRSIGDGYASIINSLHFALINQKGKPLTLGQTSTVLRVLKALRSHPFISFEAAINDIQDFDSVGLQVDPPILSELFTESDD